MPHLGHLYYEEAGSGPALVLLHGHTLDRRCWTGLRSDLQDRYRVITPDLAGHGQSGRSPAGTPYCDDLAALLDHLGIDRAAMVGLSLGGAAAVSFALHHPDRCTALVPVDAALFGHPFASWPGPRPYVKIARTEGLERGLLAWLADPLFARAMADAALAAQLRAIVLDYPGTDWLSTAPAPCPPGPPEAERLGEIAAPTLVLVGEADLPDFQAIARRLAGEIPLAKLVVVPQSGHLLPLEQPDQFRTALLPFLAHHLGA